MSLSRPVKFPLLKLPFLCIESVIKNWDIFDIIFFALTSKRTRQIVKHLKIPLNGIRIFLRAWKWIELDSFSRKWCFKNRSENEASFDEHHNSSEYTLVLLNNGIQLFTSRANDALESYTNGNEVTALKLVMEFLNEVFKCSVETVNTDGMNLPESGDIGVKSTMNLCIEQRSSPPFGYAQSQKLNLLLENLEVTGICDFRGTKTKKGFYVDPKLFKCRKLVFWSGSGAWITREILVQFEVPRLSFHYCPFSVEAVVSFVTQWFRSNNKKLEYLYIDFRRQVSLSFQDIEVPRLFQDLNPLPFSERNRVPPSESFGGSIDFSKGLEIVRHDGLSATIHVNYGSFLFYVWHNQ